MDDNTKNMEQKQSKTRKKRKGRLRVDPLSVHRLTCQSWESGRGSRG